MNNRLQRRSGAACVYVENVGLSGRFTKGYTMTKKKWELSLREARQLKNKGSAILYQRVVLLKNCYDDAEFRKWCDEQGTNAADYLDDEIADTACQFLTLLAVLMSYPNEADWVKHSIRDLIAEAMAAEKAAKPKADTSERISWKDRCLAAERECERLRAELESLKKTLEFILSAKSEHAAS